jgi:hypothetical protein
LDLAAEIYICRFLSPLHPAICKQTSTTQSEQTSEVPQATKPKTAFLSPFPTSPEPKEHQTTDIMAVRAQFENSNE